ncbi:MAG TPA: DUF3570 domain-containing protein [Rudaea sp.]
MTANRRPSPSLSLLLAASAALVGTKTACADDGSSDPTASDHHVGYRFNVYDEDAFSGGAFVGDAKRYHVDSQQFDLVTSAGGRDTLAFGATHEVMSGSSPWFLLPGPNQHPVQVMSGATIRDHRSEAHAAWTRDAGGNDTTTLSASYSKERDYSATAIGAERSIPLSSALTLGFGASFSHDRIEPTDAALYDRIERAQKNTTSFFGSLAWVLDRASVLQTGVQLNYQTGYLSDPYKLVSVGEDLLDDTRPDRRTEGAWLVRYRRAFTGSGSLHADYRFAWNSWGQHSQTLELAWYQSLGDGWRLVPGVRYYTQDQARFYAPFFGADHGNFYSSDYRLGAYGAIAANIDVRKRFGRWEFSVGAERYHAATRYGIGGGDSADPGVVSYTRAFAGLDFLFD